MQETSMRSVTDRQEQILTWIKSFIHDHGIPPTRAELARGVGLKDASCVGPHLETLAHGGRILEDEIPLTAGVAEVAAGTPIMCDAHTVERVPRSIAEQFRPRPDFLLTVRGDSMEHVVRDGDIVAVHKTPEAKSGQIVVGRFDDEVTLKRFVRVDERHIELRPETDNKAHRVMRLDLTKHILEIQGVVVGAIIRGLDDTQWMTDRKSVYG